MGYQIIHFFDHAQQQLGYTGDCGYNHFLYPTEKESRNILSWLATKLPRTAQEADDESSSEGATIADRTARALINWKRAIKLHQNPNRQVKGVRGFENLTFGAKHLIVPWKSSEKTLPTGESTPLAI
jgi:hypothetical protein